MGRHIRTHTKEKPHKCVDCGRGFLQSYDLKRHRVQVSGGHSHAGGGSMVGGPLTPRKNHINVWTVPGGSFSRTISSDIECRYQGGCENKIEYIKFNCPKHYYFFIYGPILTKSHMKVGLRTIITGKILRSSYHDNGCHGNQKSFSYLILYIYINGFVERRSGMGP